MTDRPIIFSAPMVRALLDGRKTQTRRVLCQFDPDRDPPHAGPYMAGHKAVTWTDSEGTPWRYPGAKGAATGDRLYVREAFWSCPTALTESGWDVDTYRVDDNSPAHGRTPRPSIHMPRWASRLTLNVTDVRVQRLQDISESDAEAEGVEVRLGYHDEDVFKNYGGGLDFSGYGAAKDSFKSLWNSLHGADAWDANPWCVAISFTVQHGNIDAA